MDNRKFESGASATPPSPPESPSSGYPTNGNPATATPATIPGEHWFHQIGEELRAVIVAAGLTPSNADLTQLTQAILAIAAAAAPDASTTVRGKIEIATDAEAQALTSALLAITPASLKGAFQGSNQSLASNGYQKLPGGLIVQWGSFTTNASGDASITFPIAFPGQCNSVQGTYNAGATGSFCTFATPTTTGVAAGAFNNSFTKGGAATFRYLAIGW